jgi:hypothetical protein
MRKWLLCGTIALALVISGCDSQSLMNAFTPTKEAKIGQAFLDDIRAGNFGPVEAAIDPVYKPQLTVALLQDIRRIFGGQPHKSVKIIGSRTIKSPSFTAYALTYEYELGNRWIAAEIVLENIGNRTQIEGIHVTSMAQSVEQFNAFTFAGKNAAHFIFLIVAVAIAIFSIGTTIVCWRTPIPRRKWLWRIFVLLGLVTLTLNWTTGEIRYQLFSFLLFGAGFTKQLYGPLMLQIGLPVGAVIFWIRRRAWLNRPVDETASNDT